MRSRLTRCAALLAVLVPSLAFSQTGTGRISGLVKDATGAVAPGVTVSAVQEETGVRQETVTTQAGLFLFPSLPVGPYTIRAELAGFKSVSRPKTMLTVGSDVNLTITMEPGGIEEAVVVTGESRSEER